MIDWKEPTEQDIINAVARHFSDLPLGGYFTWEWTAGNARFYPSRSIYSYVGATQPLSMSAIRTSPSSASPPSGTTIMTGSIRWPW